MSRGFAFRTDEASATFCEEIVSNMMAEFGFARDEAVGRINRQWKGADFLGDDDLRYHEEAEFWAKDITYGSDVPWHLKEPGLKPRPFP